MAGRGRTGPNRTYRIWRKTGRRDATIGIPQEIADLVPEGTVFSCEITEDGILFRNGGVPDAVIKPPSWARKTPRARAT